MSVRFGTDGIRGVGGTFPCTAEVAVAVGRAVARVYRVVLIARDPRPSGRMLEAAVAAGAAAAGAEVRLLGVLPTSGLSVALRDGLGGVGVMLTASHNPPGDNGFKVLLGGGRKPTDEETASLEAAIAAPPVDGVPGDICADARGLPAWLAAVEAATDLRPLAGRRIVVDLANGAGVVAAAWLRARLDATLIGAGDGLPNEDVGSEHPEALQEAVLAARADAGFALDGDGDRCRVVDGRGRVVDGDALAWLLTRGRGIDRLAVTVMSTAALEASLPGVAVLRVPVGDRHLLAALADGRARMGAEESGHVVFDDALPTGDGLVTGLRALAAAFSAAPSVVEAVAPFVPFPRRLLAVRTARRAPIADVPGLVAAIDDGERRLPGGRVFVRWSGTEPVLRVLAEGPDVEAVVAVAESVAAAARAGLG
jgi:phosphoglucosamine mutase